MKATLIFDPTEAQKRKDAIDAEIAAKNEWIKKGNIKMTVLSVVFALIGVACFVDFALVPRESPGIRICLIAGTGLLALLSWLCLRNQEETIGYAYTTDIIFYLATKDMNILDYTFDCPEDDTKGFGELWVTLEDKDHIVSRKRICFLDIKTSTAIDKPIFDLEKGHCLLPYKYPASLEGEGK